MKKITLHAICIATLVCMVTASAFAGGYQINEQHAKAMGMGGAFVALASDASAVYFNPAGLGFQTGTSFLLGGTVILPSTKFTGPTPSTTETSMVSQTFFPPTVYGAYAISDKLVVGLGVFTPYGLGTEWPVDWAGRRASVKTDLQTFYVNPSVAYKISDQLSIGVGVSYIFSNVKLKFRVPTYSSLAPPTPAANDGTAQLEADGTGFGFNAGVMYKAEKFSVGLSYRGLTKIDYSGTATFSDMQALTTYFPGGDGKTTLPLPSIFMGGVAYNVTNDFTVTADFQWTGWSSYDQLNVDLKEGPNFPLTGKPLQGDLSSKKDWEDNYAIKIGAEYRLEQFALRAGYMYDKTPQPDKSVEPMLPDANRNNFSVGVGYKFTDKISVDVAYLLTLFSDRTVTTPTNAFPGTYKTSVNLVGVNFGYHF